MEKWRNCVIEVSTEGRIRFAGRLLTQRKERKAGYLSVRLQSHRLIAVGFHGQPTAQRPHVNHIDGDRVNNRPENLEWCSASENSKRAVYRVRGCRHHGSKLTESQVTEIFKTKPEMPPLARDLARKFGVSVHAIVAVRSGRTWADGAQPSGRAILTREEAEEIRSYDYDKPMHLSRVLSQKYRVSQAVIQGIWNGQNYRSVTQSL